VVIQAEVEEVRHSERGLALALAQQAQQQQAQQQQ
jgi:hypothetical protein